MPGQFFGGKNTITDEFAYSSPRQNITTEHPQKSGDNQDRLPGGSVIGFGGGVSSGPADIGLGTDTGGSNRVPASLQTACLD